MLKYFRSNGMPPPPSLNYAVKKLNQLQSDLVSTARMLAVDEVGAVMAHQLNEPLTALLLYLHEIKEKGGHSADTEVVPNSMQEMVGKALRETERACNIMAQMGRAVEAPADAETAIALGREAIELLARSSNTYGNGHASPAPPHRGQHLLTPREREVLGLIVGGASNKEGGHRLEISTRTFEVHRAHIMKKLRAKNAADLVRMALSEYR